MALYTLAPNVKRQYLDNSGNPLASGKLYTVSAGGTYPGDAVTTYQTSSGTAHTNPIILDSAGRISGSSELYFEPGQSYKLIAASSSGDYLTPLWTQDNISAVPASSVNVDIIGTFGENVAAGDLVYLGAAGTWLKADSDDPAKSAIPDLGFAIEAVSSGSSGVIRTGGQIELSALIPGSAYYASATTGAITSTPGIIQRGVGTAQTTTVLDIAIKPWSAPATQPSGRLTLTTGTPVTTGDVTAATAFFYTPYKGNKLPLYDTTLSKWYEVTYAQITLAVPATTSQMYDAFVYNNAGTLTLELTAWTNDTTRATALVYQDGVYVKTGALTRLYVGSLRTTGVSGQTEDSNAKRYVWNYYNRVRRVMRVLEATDSWAYTLATLQQANASAANQLDCVIGVAEVAVSAQIQAVAANDQAAGTVALLVGIGEDSTSAIKTGGLWAHPMNPGANIRIILSASLTTYPAVGRHYYTWLEYSTAAGTTTWFGDGGGTLVQTGITGWVEG